MDELEINKPHVEKRVQDWKNRIAELYSNIAIWLNGSEYSVKPGPKLTMHEEMMFKFGVAPTEIDTIDIYKGNNYLLSFKPVGLWMIGANGRIDLLMKNESYILIDFADRFKPPQWKLVSNNKKIGSDFNYQIFMQLINK